MSRIDIAQEDGSMVAETTKEGIERHLLHRNPKLYRSEGVSPFGDTELGKQLGPFVSSKLAIKILGGTFHIPSREQSHTCNNGQTYKEN
jgi:hypothetical protein